MRKKILLCLFSLISFIFLATVQTEGATVASSRIAGETGFQTARAIADAYCQGEKVDTVILASGLTFPDALSASPLSKKLNAPILLVAKTPNEAGSKEAIDFISQNLSTNGTIYILGGTGIISSEFENLFNSMGINTIKRLGGQDLYSTNMLIVDEIKASSATSLIIASGTSFPDALSVSGIAGYQGYPILLTEKNNLPDGAKNYISQQHPDHIYVMGGTGVIAPNVVSTLEGIAPQTPITRISGNTLYDTSSEIGRAFSPSPANIYIANGANFSDALAGSSLASLDGSPIILVDHLAPSLPENTVNYLKSLPSIPSIHILGGSFVVPEKVIQEIISILSTNAQTASPDPGSSHPGAPLSLSGTAGNDPYENMEKIHDELGLPYLEDDTLSVYFDPNGIIDNEDLENLSPEEMPFIMAVSPLEDETLDLMLVINGWNTPTNNGTEKQIQAVGKELLKFYLPTSYTQVTEMLTNELTTDKLFFTFLYIDSRIVMVMNDGSTLSFIFISLPMTEEEFNDFPIFDLEDFYDGYYEDDYYDDNYYDDNYYDEYFDDDDYDEFYVA